MNNQLKTAAEESAKEYALQQMQANPDMDSAAQLVCEEDHKAGFVKGAAWVPEHVKDATEIAEDLWDKHSQHIEDSSFGFDQVAGTSVITNRDFIAAAKEAHELAGSLSAKRISFLEAQNTDLRRQCIALQNRCVEYEGQIARLEADMMGKDVAITEALAIIDEREEALKKDADYWEP